jgi:hypothetical protein
MPNQKQRKKKDGQNKSKKVQAMRASVEERKTDPSRPPRSGPFKKGLPDQPDIQRFKPGAADDKTIQNKAVLGRQFQPKALNPKK